MNIELLEEIGLTKSEINVYLALLELGSSSTGKIIDTAKVSSSKIYEILDRLMQKGLASFIIKSNIKYFEAAPPDRILDYMEEKENKLKSQKSELKNILPELEIKRSLSKYKSEATIYKGIKGLETALYDSLDLMKKGEEYVVIGVPSRTTDLNRMFVKWHRERARRGIHFRALFNENARGEAQTLPENTELAEIRFIPQTTPSATGIFKNRVVIVPQSKEPMAIVIDSKEIAESFRVQFETWWKQDVKVFQGDDGFEHAFGDILATLKKNEQLDIMGISNFDAQFTQMVTKFHKKRSDNKINANILLNSNARTVGGNLSILPKTKIKYLPNDIVTPSVFLLYGQKTLISLPNERTFMQINNKAATESFRAYFETLWNQDVIVEKGIDGVQGAWNRMLEELKHGEEYYVLGASWRGQKQEVSNYFTDFHTRRKEKGVKAKFLFVSGTEKIVEKHKDLYKTLSEVKFLPSGIYEGIQINLYKNKVLIFVWREKEPVVFTVEDKDVYQTFKSYFDTLWNQDVKVYKGFDAAMGRFESMLDECNTNEGYYVLGASYGEQKKLHEWFPKYHKKRINKKIPVKLLCDFKDTDNVREEQIGAGDVDFKFSKIKSLPPDSSTPTQINLYPPNKVLTFMWGEEFICFEIESEVLYNNFKAHFDTLWQQDTYVLHGLDAVRDTFEDMLNYENADLIGARGYFIDNRPNFIDDWEKRAQKKGFTMRNIVDPEVKGHRITKLPFSQTKYTLQKEFSQMSVIWIYGDKVAISNWVDNKPTLIVINNKDLHDMYKKQFEVLWNQDVNTFHGSEQIKQAFQEIVDEMEPGEEIKIMGLHDFGEEFLPNALFFQEIRSKKNVKAKFLINEDAKEIAEKFKKYQPAEVKLFPNNIATPTIFIIYKDKVIINIAKELTFFRIHNKKTAQTFEAYFDSLWNQKTSSSEGQESIESIYNSLLESAKPTDDVIIFAAKPTTKHGSDFNVEWNKKIRKKVKNVRLLYYGDTQINRKRAKEISAVGCATKIYKTEQTIPISTVVIGDTVVNAIWKESPTGFTIKDKTVADSLKSNFELLWNQTE
jgi:HTH-type transcriptional regulator, sugar sensing transcriptional regulator